jgi:hypothetical protein
MDNTKRHSSLGIENDVIMGPPISVPFYICDRASRGERSASGGKERYGDIPESGKQWIFKDREK